MNQKLDMLNFITKSRNSKKNLSSVKISMFSEIWVLRYKSMFHLHGGSINNFDPEDLKQSWKVAFSNQNFSKTEWTPSKETIITGWFTSNALENIILKNALCKMIEKFIWISKIVKLVMITSVTTFVVGNYLPTAL